MKETYFGVVNENPMYTGEPVVFARRGSDNAIYNDEEQAKEVREDLVEESGNEDLRVHTVTVERLEEDEA